MKKVSIIFLLTIISGSFVFEAKAQEEPLVCVLHVKQFKFKKPRLDCQRGFGLCVEIHWDVPIEVEMGAATCNLVVSFDKNEPRIEKNEVYAGFGITKNFMWLILPKSIRELEDYKDEDLTFLSIEQKVEIYSGGKRFKAIMPQKSRMKELEKYLLYEIELTD